MAFGIHTDPDDHRILVGAAVSLSMTNAAKIGVMEQPKCHPYRPPSGKWPKTRAPGVLWPDADRHRRLVVTRGALVERDGPIGPLRLPICTTVTAIADKAVRQSLGKEVLFACVIGDKLLIHSGNVIVGQPHWATRFSKLYQALSANLSWDV